MATVSKEFAQELIEGNGFCKASPEDGAPDNPSAVKIVEYTNMWNNLAYGVIFDGERDPIRYEVETQYIRNPKVIWMKKER